MITLLYWILFFIGFIAFSEGLIGVLYTGAIRSFLEHWHDAQPERSVLIGLFMSGLFAVIGYLSVLAETIPGLLLTLAALYAGIQAFFAFHRGGLNLYIEHTVMRRSNWTVRLIYCIEAAFGGWMAYYAWPFM